MIISCVLKTLYRAYFTSVIIWVNGVWPKERSLIFLIGLYTCAIVLLAALIIGLLGIDYGTNNAFAAVLLGCSAGTYDQSGKMMWVEKEYYWDSKKTERQKDVQ
jgi:phosphotransferase system  glucose/maltose/N-acetylglucosamine-specific IIC component